MPEEHGKIAACENVWIPRGDQPLRLSFSDQFDKRLLIGLGR
jgi:hypothetical protein